MDGITFEVQHKAAWRARPENWALVVRPVREALRLGLKEAIVLAHAVEWNAERAIKSWTPETAERMMRAGGFVTGESLEIANGVRG